MLSPTSFLPGEVPGAAQPPPLLTPASELSGGETETETETEEEEETLAEEDDDELLEEEDDEEEKMKIREPLAESARPAYEGCSGLADSWRISHIRNAECEYSRRAQRNPSLPRQSHDSPTTVPDANRRV